MSKAKVSNKVDPLKEALQYFALWYGFLKLNKDYQNYCYEKKANRDYEVIDNLEAVYVLWGDIFDDCSNFKKWRFRNQQAIVTFSKIKESSGGIKLAKDYEKIGCIDVQNIYEVYSRYRPYNKKWNSRISSSIQKKLLVASLDEFKRLNEDKVDASHDIKELLEEWMISAYSKEFCWFGHMYGQDLSLIEPDFDFDERSLRRIRAEINNIIANTSYNEFPKIK
ncbi:hypothetical protein [Shewanella aestuarii]|uniref:Uncharacterized protein n=1 Tax=Shewanella aestuarii TaxID=1028752 RepID=A0A6G9QHM9_9GAMM|nr:hypothetical protein [Shewanella aestuarii]QIR13567.1 hypothetical protein HBH39_02790 [Shewanella aestuarii]